VPFGDRTLGKQRGNVHFYNDRPEAIFNFREAGKRWEPSSADNVFPEGQAE
jgi:hypothetical protein